MEDRSEEDSLNELMELASQPTMQLTGVTTHLYSSVITESGDNPLILMQLQGDVIRPEEEVSPEVMNIVVDSKNIAKLVNTIVHLHTSMLELGLVEQNQVLNPDNQVVVQDV